MMLKVNSEYLEFNASIEQDRKAKLFEELDTVDGDVSFEFELELTSHNVKTLRFPFPDASSKRVYVIEDAILLSDEGQQLSMGYIKVERKVKSTLFCSFWGGNNNWFRQLTGNMTDLQLSQYSVSQDEASIKASWTETEGIVFPIIDTGALSTRATFNLKTEDFTPVFYVKTLFKEIFKQVGLKFTGELTKDWRFNNMVIASNGRSQEQVDNRSSYVLKNTPQNVSGTTSELVTFDDKTTYPYFDGSLNNFSIPFSRYTADIKMTARVQATIFLDSSLGGDISLRVNGVSVKLNRQWGAQSLSINADLALNANDYVELWFLAHPLSTFNITEATIRVTPIFLYRAFASAAVPKWTNQDFVSQILSLFNVVPAYDPFTKTVTFNLFDKIKEKEPIDISEHIESLETDYVEFISDYAKNNNFRYQEADTDNLKEYNISTFFKYGAGVVTANNDFLEESTDVLESDFTAPVSYINTPFQMSMERIPFVELDEDVSTDITSVSASGDFAQINIAEDIFLVGDLIRIENSTDESYNGEWVVDTIGSGFVICNQLFFSNNATGDVTKLIHKFTTDDSVFIFLNIPNYTLVDASGLEEFYFDNNFSGFTAAIAYFSLLNQNRQINLDYKQGLSFGPIDDPLFYQRTLLQDYWNTFSRIMNDPVSEKSICHLPWIIHNKIDFLRPLMVKTLETTNLYYCNLERGYQNSYTPCELQMIKLP